MTSMQQPRFLLFDSLRGLAALGVVVYHIGFASRTWYGGFLSHLDVGVTLFFLISGFLLYRPYARANLLGAPLPSLAWYARRRVLRIVPAYWVALTVLACWPGLTGVFTKEWWVYYGFAQSYQLRWVFSGIAPTWSLSVEVAFYAFLPLLGITLQHLGRGRSARDRVHLQLAALTALGAAGGAFRYVAFSAKMWDFLASLPVYLLWFSLGMALAVSSAMLAGREHRSRWVRLVIERPSTCWALALAIYSGIALAPGFPRPYDSGQYTPLTYTAEHVLYAAVAFLVMLPAVFGETAGGLPRRVLGSRALTGLGVISYGIFLWHEPLLKAMAGSNLERVVPGSPILSLALVLIPVAIACGWLSYRLIERPAMRLAAGSR